MLQQATITRTTNKVNAYIKENVLLAGAENRRDVFEMFDKMQLLFPQWAIMTCPMMHPELLYASKNLPAVSGYDRDQLLPGNGYSKYFSRVHDSDQEDLHNCFNYMYQYLISIPSEEHMNYRMVFHYRFMRPDRQLVYLYDEKATLNIAGSGNLYYILLRDITSEKAFTGVKVELFKQEEGMRKLTEYKPMAERVPLSKREGELVTLFRQGLSTKEIAWYLKISHNTVRNIKSKMFEKYHVNNTIELINRIS
ncbi:MAG: hypothetical protein H7Y03_02675 [Chitinophagaceae bacterium]|nr:hypothetical protein [Chitinophagaceae bacterium]